MKTKKWNARPFKNLSKYLLVLVIILILQLYPPDMLSGVFTHLGGAGIAAAAADPVIAAAGDIACDPTNSAFNSGNGNSNACRQKYTSNLLVNAGLSAVLDLGDNQYYCGGYQAFLQSYDLSWGRVKSITHPSVGNHEYLTSGGTGCDSTNAAAAGYFKYFGSAAGAIGQGYYSFNVGTWHIIALNSNCTDAGGCGSSSAQYKWLQADLAAHTNLCTLAYWHIPLYSSGGRAANNSKPFWTLLYNANADLILNGHDHIYERFAPQNASGVLDNARGIREFIVGTGGSDHTTITTIAANSELRNTATFGVLKLTLHSGSYDWQFVPEAGKTFTDSGSQACHGSVPLNTPTPTQTVTSTRTPTLALSATFTSTATSTRTATPTSTATATNTPLGTNTPTSTPTTTNTPTASATATNTPTATVTSDPAATATFTPTVTATSTPTATATFTATPTTSGVSSLTFTPVADTYVDASAPTTNNGSKTTLRTDGSPIVNSYLRFIVSGVSGTVTRVRLLIFANSSLSAGITAQAVADNSWSELSMTYNNAPAMGGALVTSSSIATGTWVTLTVTGYISADGTYSFGITDPSATAISLASREAGANAPQLVIDTQ